MKTIVELLSDESPTERSRVFFSASVTAIANVVIIAVVSTNATAPASIGFSSFAVFTLAIVAFIIGARYTFSRVHAASQSALYRMTQRIIEKAEQLNLDSLESLGAAEINAQIAEKSTALSNSAGVIANLLQSLAMLVAATIGILWFSQVAFVLVVILLVASVFVFRAYQARLDHHLAQSDQLRIVFIDMLNDLFRGFKEVKFSQRRRHEIRDDLAQSALSLRASTLQTARLFDDNWIVSHLAFFVLIGSLVFVLPNGIVADAPLLSQLLPSTMFVWGPLLGVIHGYPGYVRASHALSEMLSWEAKLDAALASDATPPETDDPWHGTLETIEARGLEYGYLAKEGDSGFRIGPLGFSIAAGEIVFLVGGNGSGKSTLLKVLTGLYRPVAGQLVVNGIVVEPKNAAAYREMISTVFVDFHLFAKLYGLSDVKEESVNNLLTQMDLKTKTSIQGQRFTRRNLSTGQRKRLAMIVALLEDRPICVFDEWAADQDPEFRRYYYEELLPTLKQRGKAVIAVSHDDRYFHCADRVVTMEYGKIRAIAPAAIPG